MVRLVEVVFLAVSAVSAYLSVRDTRRNRREAALDVWLQQTEGRIEAVASALLNLAAAATREDEGSFCVERLRYRYALDAAMNPYMESLALIDLRDAEMRSVSVGQIDEALHEVDEWLYRTREMSAERFLAVPPGFLRSFFVH
jgi:hypothetical protein